MKLFLTAATVTAIVGGWAGFTMQQSAAAQTDPEPASESAQVALEFPPMPTLVSAPGATAAASDAASVTPVPTPRPVSIGGGNGQPGQPGSTAPRSRPPTTRTRSSR